MLVGLLANSEVSLNRQFINAERTWKDFSAEKRIANAIEKIQKKYNVKINDYSKGRLSHIAYISDSAEHNDIYGLGKGYQARVGAFGECIEHLLYRYIGRSNYESIDKRTLIKSRIFRNDVVIRKALEMYGAPATYKCINFNSICNNKKILVPREYINFEYLNTGNKLSPYELFLSRYVTTSGTAFGLTENDAVLHSINEIIERDTTSEFFIMIANLKCDIKNNFFKIKNDHLPENISYLLEIIKHHYEPITIEIYGSETIFDSFWSICIARFENNSCFSIPQWGAGSSLSMLLAVYRAVAECLQMLDCFDEGNNISEKNFMEKAKNSPVYSSVAKMELSNVEIDGCPALNYEESLSFGSTQIQVEKLANKFAEHGYSLWKHVSYLHPELCISTVYSPDVEKFFNVTKGMPVLPLKVIANTVANQQ